MQKISEQTEGNPSFFDILPLLFVSLLWGLTNPLIESSVVSSSLPSSVPYNPNDFSPSSTLSVMTRKSFIVAFAINQIGSILYAYLLGVYPQQFSSIIANAGTVIVTFGAERAIKRRKVGKVGVLGIGCVMIGIWMIL